MKNPFQSHIGYDSATNLQLAEELYGSTVGFNPTLDTTQLLTPGKPDRQLSLDSFNPTLDTTQLLTKKPLKRPTEEEGFNPTLDTTQLLTHCGPCAPSKREF